MWNRSAGVLHCRACMPSFSARMKLLATSSTSRSGNWFFAAPSTRPSNPTGPKSPSTITGATSTGRGTPWSGTPRFADLSRSSAKARASRTHSRSMDLRRLPFRAFSLAGIREMHDAVRNAKAHEQGNHDQYDIG